MAMDFHDSGALAAEPLAVMKQRLLPALGRWTLQTRAALAADGMPQAGYRDLYFNSDGQSYRWEFPRSNSAERISLYLRLWRTLSDARYLDAARGYANAMLDPVYGISRGGDESCEGQVWYWRDSGLYMTNYTMRVPPAMFELYDATGDERYRAAALATGEALLRAQRENGILLEGAVPHNRKELDLVNFDFEHNADYCTDYKVNSRIGYAVYAFAVLARRTGDDRYQLALERLTAGLAGFQNPDGTFPCDLALRGYKPITALVKNHFQSYILNGTAAALREMPELSALQTVATRLAEAVLRSERQAWSWPYGGVDTESPGERCVWKSASADAAWGLRNLALVDGDSRWRSCADRLLLRQLFNTFDLPEMPDLDGGCPIWVTDAEQGVLPALGGYYHFWMMLGLLTETKEERQE